MHVVFFNDTATTEIYTLSRHDALPIFALQMGGELGGSGAAWSPERRDMPARNARRERAQNAADVLVAQHAAHGDGLGGEARVDRKSTRLNSSHANISYAVFCLKKKHML